MQVSYECQICRYVVEGRPPQWCPVCGGHRIIFKRITFTEENVVCAKTA